MPDKTGKIVIVEVPAGEAPYEIRQCWVGCNMQCKFKSVAKREGILTGVDGGADFGYIVDQAVALAALEKRSPQAALWWVLNGFPQKDKDFMFRAQEVREIFPVPMEQILVADDMETGVMELPGR